MKKKQRISARENRMSWLFSLAVWALVLQLLQPVSEMQAYAANGGSFPLCLTTETSGQNVDGIATAQFDPAGKHDCECCFAAPEPGATPEAPAFANTGVDADAPDLADFAMVLGQRPRNNPIRGPPVA